MTHTHSGTTIRPTQPNPVPQRATRPPSRLGGAMLTLVMAITVSLTGCTTSPPLPTPSATTAPADMTHDQLLELAISQYKHLFELRILVEFHGGAMTLPSTVSQYIIDPALSAMAKLYRDEFVSGAYFTSMPDSHVTAIAELIVDDPPTGTLIAVQACELTQGAAQVYPDGTVRHDGSPAMSHRRAYLKIDPIDGALKVFILNGDKVETCPIN